MESIVLANTADHKFFVISAQNDIRQEIFDFSVATNNKILTMRMAERKMEEVFRN